MAASECRACRVKLDAPLLPGYMGVGALFGEEEEHFISEPYCSKCQDGDVADTLCPDFLSCDHYCLSHKTHKECPKYCIEPGCHKNSVAQAATDDCVFCTEPLHSKPCVYLECKHVFHYDCIADQIGHMGSNKGPISLNFSRCPYCSVTIKWDVKPYLYDNMSTLLQKLDEQINHLKHLVHGQVLHEKIEVPAGNDEFEFGMKKFNFYSCNKCKSIFYGGKRECGAADEEVISGEILCDGCRGCSKHGGDFMVYKCRFCCTPAIWFCWGHTHFCESCHNRAGQFNNGYAHDALPVCPGPHLCPLKMEHPPNGQEFAVCCGACRDEATKVALAAEMAADFMNIAALAVQALLHEENRELSEELPFLFDDEEPAFVAPVARVPGRAGVVVGNMVVNLLDELPFFEPADPIDMAALLGDDVADAMAALIEQERNEVMIAQQEEALFVGVAELFADVELEENFDLWDLFGGEEEEVRGPAPQVEERPQPVREEPQFDDVIGDLFDLFDPIELPQPQPLLLPVLPIPIPPPLPSWSPARPFQGADFEFGSCGSEALPFNVQVQNFFRCNSKTLFSIGVAAILHTVPLIVV